MDKQLRMDKMYLQIARVIANQSYAQRAKVGALIVKDDNILSFGYNGTPAGFDNCCECQIESEHDNGKITVTKREVLHAESNAFMKLVRTGGFGCKGGTLYCTYSPCIECAKMIIQSGIKRVVYELDYRVELGCELLKQAGVELTKISLDDSTVKQHTQAIKTSTDRNTTSNVTLNEHGTLRYLNQVIATNVHESDVIPSVVGVVYVVILHGRLPALMLDWKDMPFLFRNMTVRLWLDEQSANDSKLKERLEKIFAEAAVKDVIIDNYYFK